MERTTFNIVQEVQKAETTISVDAKQSTDFSFSICEKVIVTKELVASKLDDIVDNVDTARYIL